MEKIKHASTKQKKTEAAILISDKADFKARKVMKNKEGNYILTVGSVFQEDINNS